MQRGGTKDIKMYFVCLFSNKCSWLLKEGQHFRAVCTSLSRFKIEFARHLTVRENNLFKLQGVKPL